MSVQRMARLRVTSGADPEEEILSLRSWLAGEDELRGCVETGQPVVREGEMGVAFDAVVVLLGSGSAVTVLARAVPTWLKQRHSDVTVEITSPDGRTVKVTAQRVGDAEAIIRGAFREIEPRKDDN
jgi:hypothetical protein